MDESPGPRYADAPLPYSAAVEEDIRKEKKIEKLEYRVWLLEGLLEEAHLMCYPPDDS